METLRGFLKSRTRFDRNELSGAFGDIGTVFPLIAGLVAVTGMDGAMVFIVFGIMQLATALAYGIPMPVQPLKVAALVVITQKLSGGVLAGGGLVIGITMLVLTFTGLVDLLGRYVPRAVVRGVQLGLGLQLALLALREYIPSDSMFGNALAAASFIIILVLSGNRRFPPALLVIMMGVAYGVVFNYRPDLIHMTDNAPSFRLNVPSPEDMIAGFLFLAIPQIPLSLGNSIYATRQLARDLFPGKNISVKKIALTYSLMNIASSFTGGVPVCHGSGGMAGHYTFGARTGGSMIICGSLFLAAGLIFGGSASVLLSMFPRPVLGVILLFEGLALLRLVYYTAGEQADILIMLLVGVCSISLPYGYIVGMAAGTMIHYFFRRRTAMPAGTMSGLK